jgi:hypothetical protein
VSSFKVVGGSLVDVVLSPKSEASFSVGGVARCGLWVVRGGSLTFYSSILRRYGEAEVLRFNRTCMQPVSRHSADIGEDFATTLLLTEPVEHTWQIDEVLIFDNGRVVHARPTGARS